MSDNGASDDDDAKTERYRDPTPPGDNFVPGGEEYMPIAAATGLLLPIVTREQARDAQQDDDDNEPDRYDKDDAAAAKEPTTKKQKKSTADPKKQQLRQWLLRYKLTGTNPHAKMIDYTEFRRELKRTFDVDITFFKQAQSKTDAAEWCIVFHTSKRMLVNKMFNFINRIFNLPAIHYRPTDPELIALQKDPEGFCTSEEFLEIQNIESFVHATTRIVRLEHKVKQQEEQIESLTATVKRLKKQDDHDHTLSATVKRMKQQIAELRTTCGIESEETP